MIKMSENRAKQVKMQNTPIAFLHPHNQPYRYLGVDLTQLGAPHGQDPERSQTKG